MSSFLDRQTISHVDVEKRIYSNKIYKPNRKIFLEYVSTILNEKIEDNSSIDPWFQKIRPDFDENVVNKSTKAYAFEYSEHLKTKINSHERYNRINCPKTSIEMPEIVVHHELGGRLV